MSAERYAFVSVYRKTGLNSMARELSEQYQLVSYGGTGLSIAEAGVPVISADEFIGDPLLSSYVATLRDRREARDTMAARLGQHMSQPHDVLAAEGRQAIDLAYINLIPPSMQAEASGGRPGIDMDMGAIMIWAAIAGGRDVVTSPGQMADFLAALQGSDSATRRRTLGIEALAYFQKYTSEAMLLGKLSLRDAT